MVPVTYAIYSGIRFFATPQTVVVTGTAPTHSVYFKKPTLYVAAVTGTFFGLFFFLHTLYNILL
jgi:hypothetical protein